MIQKKVVALILFMIGVFIIFIGESLAFGRARVRDPDPLPTNRAPVQGAIPPKKQYQFYPVGEFANSELADLYAAENLVNQTIKTPCFRAQVLSRPMIQTNGMTEAKILDVILTNAPRLPVRQYRDDKNVLGEYDGEEKSIYVNSRSYFHQGLCGQARTLLHETMHFFGFVHDVADTSRRALSVPYQVGDALYSCCI